MRRVSGSKTSPVSRSSRPSTLSALGVGGCPAGCEDADAKGHTLHLAARAMVPEIHQRIADWYVKLFQASNDANAALESIYHRIRGAIAAGNDTAASSCRDAGRAAALTTVRDELCHTALLEAVRT